MVVAGAGSLLLGERYFVDKLLIINRLDFHIDPVRFRVGLVLSDSKRLPSLGSTLVNNIEFKRWMLLKEVAKHEFGLSFTI